jgi:hypothetical protein
MAIRALARPVAVRKRSTSCCAVIILPPAFFRFFLPE